MAWRGEAWRGEALPWIRVGGRGFGSWLPRVGHGGEEDDTRKTASAGRISQSSSFD